MLLVFTVSISEFFSSLCPHFSLKVIIQLNFGLSFDLIKAHDTMIQMQIYMLSFCGIPKSHQGLDETLKCMKSTKKSICEGSESRES